MIWLAVYILCTCAFAYLCGRFGGGEYGALAMVWPVGLIVLAIMALINLGERHG